MSDTALAAKRAESRIGIWYAIWYDTREVNSFWDNDGGPTKLPIFYKPLLKDESYGRYSSGDAAMLDYHLEAIADAEIDFIIMDQTNDIDNGDGSLNENSLLTAQKIKEWNDAGNRPIKYCSSIGAYAELTGDFSIIESEAKKLWERYVEAPWGTEEYHEYVDGKPLMVIFPMSQEQGDAYDGDKTYANKFTIRFAFGHAYEPGYWGWVMPKGTLVTEDVACIIPSWFKFNHPYEKVYREKGSTYKKNWETLLASDVVPRFVVINSFNEYAEHTAVYTADTSDFPDDYPIEQWIDGEGNKAPSLYWDMTKAYIQKYKKGDLV